MARQTIKDTLGQAELIRNGYHVGGADLHSRLDGAGYTSAAMTDFGALLDRAHARRWNALSERGDRSGATKALNLQRDQVAAQLSAALQTAGAVFVDDVDARTTLGLEMPDLPTHPAESPADGTPPEPPQPRRDQSLAGLLDRGRIFYGNALSHPEIAAPLAAQGYPATRLEKEQGDLEALGVADAEQEREKGESTGATADQKAALAELKAWIARFARIVVPALKDKPEYLTALGLKQRGGARRTTKTK